MKRRQKGYVVAMLFYSCMTLAGCEPDPDAVLKHHTKMLEQCTINALTTIPTEQANARGDTVIQCMKASGAEFN